jgi:hypothetical protein
MSNYTKNICNICKKEYVSDKNLKIHMDKFHKNEPIVDVKAKLTSNVIPNTKQEIICCSHCNKVFKSKSGKSKHEKTCANIPAPLETDSESDESNKNIANSNIDNKTNDRTYNIIVMTKEELLKFRKDPVLTDFLFKNNMIVVNRDFAPEFFTNLGLPGLIRPRTNKYGTPINSNQQEPNSKLSEDSEDDIEV